MSEFLAEARVLILPDTAKFRATLQAQLNAVQASIRPVTVPVVGLGQGAASAATGQLTTAITDLTAAINAQNAALGKNAAAASQAAGAQKTLAATQRASAAASKEVQRGILAQTLGFAGLRGAVLGANTSFLVAAAGALTFFKSLQTVAQLDQDLATFRVTVGATADEMERVSDTAEALGRDLSLPGVTASNAAESMLALARAGLSVQDSIDGARGSLQLATAAETDQATAATLVANALNAFGLAGEQAVRVADLLANAANESQGSIEDMGIALRQSAAVANQVGLTVQQTVVFLTQLARAGLAGSDAGTTLRVALTRLVAPTEAAADQIEKLGLDLRDAQGNLRPDIFVQLGVALQGFNRAAQDRAFKDIFGENAQRVAAILSRQGLPALQDTTVALRKQGTAAEIAAAKNEGLAGSTENAKNQVSAFLLEVGKLVKLPAIGFLDSMALFFGALANQIRDTREEFGKFNDDAEQIAEGLRGLSDDSGFTDFVGDVADGARLINQDLKNAQDAVTGFAGGLLGIERGAEKADPPLKTFTETTFEFAHGAGDAGAAAQDLTDELEKLARAAGRLASPQAVLTLNIEGARAGGDEGELVDLLREREANLERFIKRLSQRRQTRAVVETLTRANQDLDQVRTEIQSILDRQASENEQAARDAQSSRDKADQAFLDLLLGKREKRERFIAQAEGTESLRDDILLRERFIRLLNNQIENVRKTIRDAKVRAATIRALTAEIVQIGNEIKRLREEQRQAIKDAAAERQARIAESIQLDIDLAQTVGNVQAEIRARLRLIALLRKQQAAVKKGTLEWKRLRNAIAEQQKAIEEAQKQEAEKNKAGKTLAQSQFEFMQSLQGFSTNLLGNLIPGFATGGLVGPGSGQTTRPLDVGGAPQERVAQADAVRSAQDRGVRPIQVDTTNQLLRQILRTLQGHHAGTGHPEIAHNRQVGAALMDTFGTVHGA